MSDPQEITPFNPVRDRAGAESVPRTEAPLVAVWESAGTSDVRLRMPLTTTEAAEAILELRLSFYRDSVGNVVMKPAVFGGVKNVRFERKSTSKD